MITLPQAVFMAILLGLAFMSILSFTQLLHVTRKDWRRDTATRKANVIALISVLIFLTILCVLFTLIATA